MLLAAAAAPDFQTTTNLDSRSYQATLSTYSLADTLQYTRTVGYPIFLRTIFELTGGYGPVAYLQLLFYLLAVVGFGLAAELAWDSGWLALAAASPLFYARVIHDYADDVMPDTLAAAFAVAALASLLWWLARRESRPALASMGLFLFLAYQARPAYLFLLALVPLLGVVLALRRAGTATWKQAPRRTGLVLVLTAWLPFLAWSGFRWAVAGHFGLVSFGGINLIGITGSMLSPAVIRGLPPSDQPLARAILAVRREQGLAFRGVYHNARWVQEYNQNIWGIAFKAADGLYRRPDQTLRQFWVDANHRFTRLSFAVIRARSWLYLRWIYDSLDVARIRIAGEPTIRWPALLLLASATCRLLWVVGRRLWSGRPAPRVPTRRFASLDLGLLAGAYLAASLLLIVAVEPPVNRYIFAAALFLPSAFCAAALELWLPRSPRSSRAAGAA